MISDRMRHFKASAGWVLQFAFEVPWFPSHARPARFTFANSWNCVCHCKQCMIQILLLRFSVYPVVQILKKLGGSEWLS